MKTTTEIYNTLRKQNGKLAAFSKHLVDIGIYTSISSAHQALRFGTAKEDIAVAYEAWNVGKFKTMDIKKHNDKLKEVFRDIKAKGLKSELIAIQEVLEEALMELTLGIKNNDQAKLSRVKEMLQEALYANT